MGEVAGTSESARPRILFVASDADQARVIQRVLTASSNPPFEVVRALTGWDAQRQSADGSYAALILDSRLADTDGETLLGRLRSTGIVAPALLLTLADLERPATNHVTATDAEQLTTLEAVSGNSLVRALVAMMRQHELAGQLAAARDELASARATLATFAHDLATPLGVVLGMSQLLLASDYGLNDDGRSCLEDVAVGAARACELLDAVGGKDAVPVAPASYGAQPVAPTSHESVRSTVLIADDDAATRRLVALTLASDRYHLLQAADGAEAWRLIREHHPAVAILDWQMPIYSGLELSDVIKGDPQVWGMTVIMLTGRNAPADREAGARARADVYLVKPFSPPELLAAVEHALGIA